jgi:Spy/CpxP family protein refolding chaperone
MSVVRSMNVVAITMATVAAMLAAGGALAQHGGHLQHGGGQGHRVAQSCAEEFTKVIGEGRGFGMAFVADQNGYPGPMHMLELKDRLQLTPQQEAKADQLQAAVKAERPKSTRLLEAERRLERLFAERAATEETVRAAVTEIERARTEVRLVHLLTHLRTRDLLTEEQRRIYHEARWSRP